MKYRSLNSCIQNVSVIGIGANIFGYSCDNKTAKRMISSAHDLGINYIDTADVYSDGLSESWIGDFTKNTRSQWLISTKSGIRSGQSIVGRNTKLTILENVKKSLVRLKTDYIDIYQLHNYDPITPAEEIVDAASYLLDKGYVRSFGCSNYFSDHLCEIDLVDESIISTNQVHMNFVHRSHAKEIEKIFSSKQKKIIAYGVLGRGVLTGKYLNDYGANYDSQSRAMKSINVKSDLSKDFIEKLYKLGILLSEYNLSLLDFCIHFVLQNQSVLSMLIGLRTEEQLLSVCESVDSQVEDKLWEHLNKYIESEFSNLSVSLGKPK